eukprot:9903500-Alexandrium_andersonii.AAC.1
MASSLVSGFSAISPQVISSAAKSKTTSSATRGRTTAACSPSKCFSAPRPLREAAPTSFRLGR